MGDNFIAQFCVCDVIGWTHIQQKWQTAKKTKGAHTKRRKVLLRDYQMESAIRIELQAEVQT